jgi:hypothetical protein
LKTVLASNGKLSKLIPCLGDESVRDEKEGLLLLPASPELASSSTLALSDCSLHFPDRDSVEESIVQYYSIASKIEGLIFAIRSRSLRIGL